jgi:hypothetical protein
LRGEQIAEDFDALSLAHNLVVPPNWCLSPSLPRGLRAVNRSNSLTRLTQSRRNVDASRPFAYWGMKIARVERNSS